MDAIFTPEFMKYAGTLVLAGAYFLRQIGHHEKLKADAERLRLEEQRTAHTQLIQGLQTIQQEQRRLSAWAGSHERADRIRFKRVERRLDMYTPHKQAC